MTELDVALERLRKIEALVTRPIRTQSTDEESERFDVDGYEFDGHEFAARLRLAIEARGLSLSEAARLLNTTHSRISEYVNGHRVPPVPRLLEIVHVLGLDIRLIFPSTEPEP